MFNVRITHSTRPIHQTVFLDTPNILATVILDSPVSLHLQFSEASKRQLSKNVTIKLTLQSTTTNLFVFNVEILVAGFNHLSVFSFLLVVVPPVLVKLVL